MTCVPYMCTGDLKYAILCIKSNVTQAVSMISRYMSI